MSDQPTPVLDYAPPVPQKRARRWMMRALLVLLCAIAGAGLGRAFMSRQWVVSTYILIPRSGPLVNPTAVQGGQQQLINTIKSSAPQVATSLSGNGSFLPPAQIVSGLSFRAVPDTELIQVNYTDSDPTRAMAVVNALLAPYNSPSAAGAARISGMTLRQGTPVFMLIGFVIGAVVGVMMLVIRRKTR